MSVRAAVPEVPGLPGPGVPAEGGEVRVTGTTWAMAARVFAENRLAIAGVVFVVMVFLFCFLGPLLYRTNQINTDIANITQPPSPAHPLGTDNVGYDLLGRLMVGGQTSLEIGLTAAETGHLVFGTLHTQSAPEAIDRIIDVFPPHQQQQIRVQLASVLEAVISQQLLPNMQFMAGRSERRTVAAAVGVSAARSSSTGGDGKRTRWPTLEEVGRVPAVEIMIATPAIRNLIREAKSHQIHTSIQTGAQFGMQTMDQSLFALYTRRLVTLENALARAIFPDELRKIIERGGQ